MTTRERVAAGALWLDSQPLPGTHTLAWFEKLDFRWLGIDGSQFGTILGQLFNSERAGIRQRPGYTHDPQNYAEHATDVLWQTDHGFVWEKRLQKEYLEAWQAEVNKRFQQLAGKR